MMVDIIIERLHPVGYIETLSDGTRLAPTNDTGNQSAEVKWEVCAARLLLSTILVICVPSPDSVKGLHA